MNTQTKEEYVQGSNPEIDIQMTRLAITTAHERIDESIKHYRDVGEELDKNDVYLRVGVAGGGCAGFKYEILPEAGCNESTCAVTEFDGIKIAVDFITYPYLEGAKIYFAENEIIAGAGEFLIKNSNWDSTCSCGESFSV